MLYRCFQPAPPLSDFVDNFWLYDEYVPPQPNDRVLPSGTMEMVINLRDDELRISPAAQPERCHRFSGALVSGAYSGFFVIDTRQEASLLGVHFKQGGAVPFLGLPASELADAHVDLETLWGPPAPRLRDRLCTASTAAERFGLMEEALVARLSCPRKRHDAVPVALAALGQSAPKYATDASVRVRDVAGLVGLSQRRFIQVFKAEVGMTPKLFCRVQRFQRALARVRQTTTVDWARLAVDCGYFDQSHFIRDFLAFSGFRPTEYLHQHNDLRGQGVHIKHNHVPLIK